MWRCVQSREWRREEARESMTELELELIQTQMAQKPMLRAEVYARAMRASQLRKKRKCVERRKYIINLKLRRLRANHSENLRGAEYTWHETS